MLRCAKCGAGVQPLQKCRGCGEPAPAERKQSLAKLWAVVLLSIMVFVVVGTMIELSEKRSILPAGGFGLLLAGVACVESVFPQRWTIRRAVVLFTAVVLGVLSSFQLIGVKNLGFYAGAATLVVAITLIAQKSKRQ